MTPDLLAIVERSHAALDRLRRCDPGAAVLCEHVLAHDIAPLISRIRYLERLLADHQSNPTPCRR
jgi:hypothetical protein